MCWTPWSMITMASLLAPGIYIYVNKIKGNIDPSAPVHSKHIRVGRSIDGFCLSPGITKEQRIGIESLMNKAFANLTEDLAGTYFPVTGMNEAVRCSFPRSLRSLQPNC